MEATVGKILKEKRESLHLTIEEVAKQVSLRSEHLEKIENDDFSVFKSPIYAKGTIRCYANLLGLDGVALVEQFKENQLADAVFASTDVARDTVDAITKSKVKVNLVQQPGVGTQTSFSKDGSPLPIGQIVVGFILVCVIAAGCYFTPNLKFDKAEITFFDKITTRVTELFDTMTNLVSENRSEKQQIRDNVAKVENAIGFNQKLKEGIETKNKNKAILFSKNTDKTLVKPENNKQGAKVDSNAVLARSNKVIVEMTANGQCWIDVFSDGKAVYSGMMTKGRYKIFEANKRVTVRYGNIGVMQVVLNGKPVNMRGEVGVATCHYPQ